MSTTCNTALPFGRLSISLSAIWTALITNWIPSILTCCATENVGSPPWSLSHIRRGGVVPRGAHWQILATRDESQWIVAARPLYHLQYPVATKSSAEDLPQWRVELSCLAPVLALWTWRGNQRVCSSVRTGGRILSRVTSLGKWLRT